MVDSRLIAARDVKLAGGALVALNPPKIIAIGDSITSTMVGISGAGGSNQSTFANASGELSMLQAICPRFRIDTWADTIRNVNTNLWGACLGQGGLLPKSFDPQDYDTSAGTAGIQRLNQALNMRPDVLFIALGANGLNTGAANQNTVIRRIVSYARARWPDMAIIVAGVRATAASKEGAGFPKATIVALNNLLRTIDDPANKIWFWDSYGAYDQGDGYGASSYYSDDLHPIITGAIRAVLGGATYTNDNKSLLWVIRQILPAQNVLLQVPGHTLLTDYPNRGIFNGTGGQVFNGASGSVAANMRGDGPTTYGAAVLSLEANSETGGYSQKFVITPNGTLAANTHFLLEPINASNSSTHTTGRLANQWGRLWAEFDFDTWDYWATPQIYLQSSETGPLTKTMYGGPYNTAGDVLGQAYIQAGDVPGRMWACTQPCLFGPSTSLSIQLRPQWKAAGQVTPGTVKIRRWNAEVIDDPTRAYLFG